MPRRKIVISALQFSQGPLNETYKATTISKNYKRQYYDLGEAPNAFFQKYALYGSEYAYSTTCSVCDAFKVTKIFFEAY